MKEIHLKYKQETDENEENNELYDSDLFDCFSISTQKNIEGMLPLKIYSDSYVEWLEDLTEQLQKENIKLREKLSPFLGTPSKSKFNKLMNP